MSAAAMVAAENHHNPWVTYDEHLAYEELESASEQELTQSQVDDILANDADLNALFQDVLGQGFKYYGNAVLLTLDSGNVSAFSTCTALNHHLKSRIGGAGSCRLHFFSQFYD